MNVGTDLASVTEALRFSFCLSPGYLAVRLSNREVSAGEEGGSRSGRWAQWYSGHRGRVIVPSQAQGGHAGWVAAWTLRKSVHSTEEKPLASPTF